jgi:hypothetical protein
MTWYLSGPMTGYENLNFPAFSYAAMTLRAQGLTLISPHENDLDIGEWDDYLRHDIKLLADCHGLVLLRGWTKSKGAQMELWIALRLGLPVRFFDEQHGELIDIG